MMVLFSFVLAPWQNTGSRDSNDLLVLSLVMTTHKLRIMPFQIKLTGFALIRVKSRAVGRR